MFDNIFNRQPAIIHHASNRGKFVQYAVGRLDDNLDLSVLLWIERDYSVKVSERNARGREFRRGERGVAELANGCVNLV